MLGQIVYRFTTENGVCYSSVKTEGNIVLQTLTKENIQTGIKNEFNPRGNEVFSWYGASGVTRVSIQAPPGTRFSLSKDEGEEANLMISYSGIFEYESSNIGGIIFNETPKYFILDFEYGGIK